MGDNQLQRGFIILFLLLAIGMRVALVNWELPYYSIDENDVVEPALAFLCGDWAPRWYSYGPLFSYLLAIIYKVWMWTAAITLGWTDGDFFYAAFFEPTSFYVLARAFHALIVIGVAGLSWLFARRNFDPQTAVVGLILGLAPFLDINTNFTVRIDTLQGLLSLSSLFFATQFGKDRIKLRPYVMAGIFAGLCIATKPLSGLLVLPALLFGHFLSVWQTTNLSHKKKIEFAIREPKLWILVCSVIFVYSLANLYSVIDFKNFLWELYNVIFSKEAQGGKFAGYDFSWMVSKWGWPMSIAVAIALLTALRRSDNATRILLVYIAVFCCAFLPFETREYWYNVVFPAVILIVARLISGVSQSVGKYLLNLRRMGSQELNDILMRLLAFVVMILFIGILTSYPLWRTGLRVYANWFSSATPLEKRADHAGQLWIESNLPAHSSILLVGFYAINLPRILADTAEIQAKWGEYFMYHRRQNLPWGEAFKNAYVRLQQTGRPTYQLENIRQHYSDDNSDPKLNSLFRKDLPNYARQSGFKYIVTASPKKYKGKWEDDPRVKILATFNGYSGSKLYEVKIFEVLPIEL